MSVIITASVPTVYQLNSLLQLGMGFKKNLDGSFSASKEFKTVDDAKLFLKEQATYYFQTSDDPFESLEEMSYDIEVNNKLTIDAATAQIIINNN